MALVKQVRILRNVFLTGLFCAAVLWFVRGQIIEHIGALVLGVIAGTLYGLLHWWQLCRKITRQDRRFERNKILVQYLSAGEAALAAVAYNHYLAIPLVLAAVVALIVGWFAHWWAVLASSFGLAGSIALAVCILRRERENGPLYYQYDSRSWQGAEGMLYEVGTVVQSLSPRGMIRVKGELWSATSASGETIGAGERVEVIGIRGLMLEVDKVPNDTKATGDPGRRPS